jgi:hypothetical protein
VKTRKKNKINVHKREKLMKRKLARKTRENASI